VSTFRWMHFQGDVVHANRSRVGSPLSDEIQFSPRKFLLAQELEIQEGRSWTAPEMSSEEKR